MHANVLFLDKLDQLALALGLICSKCHSPYRGRGIIRSINPSARALTGFIPKRLQNIRIY